MDLKFGILIAAGFASSLPLFDISNCPPDWMHGGSEGCFKFLPSKTNKSWMDAQYECERVGGFLAEPKSGGEMELLEEIASFYGVSLWWIGLSDTGHEGLWFWQHSEEIAAEEFWDRGAPSEEDGNRLDCAYVYLVEEEGLVWRDADCRWDSFGDDHIAPICQKETGSPDVSTTQEWKTTTQDWQTTRTTPEDWSTTRTTTEDWKTTQTTTEDWKTTNDDLKTTTEDWQTTTEERKTTTADGCPDAWSEFEGSCHYLILEEMPWLDAREKCYEMGADLASVHSQKHQDFILDLIKAQASKHDFWLGGSDSHSEGNWAWSDGSPWDYEFWGEQQGNHGTVFNCLICSYHGPHVGIDSQWSDDIDCFHSLPFICQTHF